MAEAPGTRNKIVTVVQLRLMRRRPLSGLGHAAQPRHVRCCRACNAGRCATRTRTLRSGRPTRRDRLRAGHGNTRPHHRGGGAGAKAARRVRGALWQRPRPTMRRGQERAACAAGRAPDALRAASRSDLVPLTFPCYHDVRGLPRTRPCYGRTRNSPSTQTDLGVHTARSPTAMQTRPGHAHRPPNARAVLDRLERSPLRGAPVPRPDSRRAHARRQRDEARRAAKTQDARRGLVDERQAATPRTRRVRRAAPHGKPATICRA